MLKMIGLSDLAPRELAANEVVGGGDKADNKNLSKSKKLKNVKSEIQIYIRTTEKPTFLTSGTKKSFN